MIILASPEKSQIYKSKPQYATLHIKSDPSYILASDIICLLTSEQQ